MRALIQRVTSGKVTVEGETVAEIGHGLVILLGIGQGDTEEQARFLAEKIATLRIFEDSDRQIQPVPLGYKRGSNRRFAVYTLQRHPQGPASLLYGGSPARGRRAACEKIR